MKLISLWEPWATLMALKAKAIETRSWGTSYRGWLAIHASKGGLSQGELRCQCFERPFYEALQAFEPFARAVTSTVRFKRWMAEIFPHGNIVAVARLIDCCPTNAGEVFERHAELDTTYERAFGNYEANRWGWVVADVFRLPQPIPFKAKQGLVTVDESTLAAIRAQWREVQARQESERAGG